MKKTLLAFTASFLLASILTACVTTEANWPKNIPSRSVFIEAYEKYQNQGKISSSLNEHLIWIKRFYVGTIIHPIGWRDMTDKLLVTLDNESERASVKARLFELGKKIAIEWAQDNDSRLINSAAIVTWANAVRTSVERGEQIVLLGKVERDVDALLDRSLTASQIKRERYYPEEDFDDF